MRRADLESLERFYEPTPGGGHRSSDEAFAEQIGAALPNTRALARAVFADLDDEAGIHGVGWWYPHPGTKRRILISDYLVSTLPSVETNLTESRLHYLEAIDAFDAEDEFVSRMVDYDRETGVAEVQHPERTRGVDDLARISRDLHVVGFLRAIGSALDCLAAGIVGVLALPLNVQRAALSQVRSYAERKTIKQGSPHEQIWKPSFDALNGLEDPNPGWLSWTLDYRNTLVHRARPTAQFSLVPTPTLERLGSRVPYHRTSQVMLLSSTPARSTVEVLQAAETPVLTEDARDTMGSAARSGDRLVG